MGGAVLGGDGSADVGDRASGFGAVGSGRCDLRFGAHHSSWLEVIMRGCELRVRFSVKLLDLYVNIFMARHGNDFLGVDRYGCFL